MRRPLLVLAAVLLAGSSVDCGGSPPSPRPAAAPPPVARAEGDLAPAAIAAVVRRDALGMQQCYQDGLHRNRRLRGTVSTRFVIARDGRVERAVGAVDGGGAFPDAVVAECVVGRFRRMVFPPPDGGQVTVVYPLSFAPD